MTDNTNAEKLPYQTPELQKFGTIADLVTAMEGGGGDGAGFFPDDQQS